MSKHTPGPWSVSEKTGARGAVQYSGGHVAFTCAPRDASDERLPGESWLDMRDRTQDGRLEIVREQDANARLIAAAPELLDALEALCNRIELETEVPASEWPSLQAARAAISNATGEAA